MHYEQQYDEDLFQKITKTRTLSTNPLRDYISSSDEDLFDLPVQMTNNPFAPARLHPENRPFYSKNNHSISKCAVTEISSKTEEQCEQSITPVCQKLFDHHALTRIEKEFDLPQTLSSEQLINEATFKPNDLREYLQNNSQQRDGSKLKQILRDNIFNQPKPNKEARSRVASSHISSKVEEVKQKTKYEKILEEYFNSKSKKEAIKSRLSQEKLQTIRMQYMLEQNHQQSSKIQTQDEPLRNRQNKEKTSFQAMSRSKSEKQITTNSKVTTSLPQKTTLTKTFSQSQLLKEKPREGKEICEGWMRMNFEERQSRTLQNRKNKQNMGQKLNKQKEVKQCTFKPAILDFKAPKAHPVVSGSYARLYYEKIRRRV